MAAFQKTFYMAIWRQGKDQQDDPNYVSRTYASKTSKYLGIDTDSWEVTATDRDAWRHTVKVGRNKAIKSEREKAS